MKNTAVRAVLAFLGLICAALGIIGIFVPVLPTTPLLLLAAFLFARSSQRLNAWLSSTKAYQNYVLPFRENRGIERRAKIRILAISYTAVAISAFAVRNVETWNIVVWAILGCVVAFLFYLVVLRLPTLQSESSAPATFDAAVQTQHTTRIPEAE